MSMKRIRGVRFVLGTAASASLLMILQFLNIRDTFISPALLNKAIRLPKDIAADNVRDLSSKDPAANNHQGSLPKEDVRAAKTRTQQENMTLRSRNNSQSENFSPLPPTTTKTATAKSTAMLDHHLFCRAEQLLFPSISDNRTVSMPPVAYQCRGEAYDNFTSRLEKYVQQKQDRVHNESWGTREFPFPANATILAMGNSHTEQTLLTLLCQYAHQVTKAKTSAGRGVNVHFIEFANNASLVLVPNSPLVYSKEWPSLLKKYDPLEHSLQTFDAVILGAFNRYSRDAGNGTNFQRMVLAYEREHPDEIDFAHVPAPSLYRLTQKFKKPVIAVPMFAVYGRSWASASKKTIWKLKRTKRNNVVLLNSRAHVEALGHECGSDGKFEIGVCLNRGDSSPYGRDPENMHRCTGPKGGHADLVAWDVIEHLYDQLKIIK